MRILVLGNLNKLITEMHVKKKPLTFISRSLICLIAATHAVGCSSTSFGGKSTSTNHPISKSQDADPSTSPTPAPEPAATPPATDTADAKPSTPSTDLGTGTCTEETALDYNIMFIFDKTGSQLTTDPTLVRRSGALQFLTQLSTYAASNPKVAVYSSVLAFNTQSIRASSGWLLVNSTNAPTIAQQITVATSNPEGATSYSPVLRDASSFFDQVNSQPNAAKARNYIVFLTDGEPNADTQPAIDAAVNTLVTRQNVAIIAVAAGPEVSAAGESVVRNLALPTQSSKFPDHVGQFYRAANDVDFTAVWSKLFTKIGGCATK